VKRSIIAVLILGLVAGALSTSVAAGKKKKKKKKRIERVVEVRYDNPAVGSPGVGGATTVPGTASGPEEVWLSVEQTDDVSPLPFVRIAWDTDGDGSNDTGFTVCGGQTEEPVEIPAGTEFSLFPYVLPGPECPTGFNTMGTIRFTFSNKP
jgi:hypothetical protein